MFSQICRRFGGVAVLPTGRESFVEEALMKKSLTEAEMARQVHRAKRANYITLGVLLCLFVAVAGGILLSRVQRDFSTEAWLADPTRRTAIVDDLLLNTPLTGRSEAAVHALLGPPDQEECAASGTLRLRYCLGTARGLMPIDREWLILTLTGGVVTEVALTTD